MKKALALVFALVLALSLSVSAFALQLVELEKAPVYGSAPIPVKELAFDEDGESVVIAGEGGTYYVQLDKEDYKNVTVSASGAVSAKVVEYDPAKFADVASIRYAVYDRTTGLAVSPSADGVGLVLQNDRLADKNKVVVWGSLKDTAADYHFVNVGYYAAADGFHKVSVTSKWTDGKVYKYDAAAAAAANAVVGAGVVKEGDTAYYVEDTVVNSASDIQAIADLLNEANRTTQFYAKALDNTTLIELTIEDNFSAAYKEGTVKISATLNKKPVSATLTVIRDVTIFKYEEVKYAAEYESFLTVGNVGYSDYLTAVNGYGTPAMSGSNQKDASVVSTTAFRAIKGEALEVLSNDLTVIIPEVAEGQKGVNFASYEVDFLNSKGKHTDKNDVVAIDFGFYGNQVIASDFEIEVNLGNLDFFELREKFGKKVEEEDIITYYVLKDGKAYDSFTVDYMQIDPTDLVKLSIEGKAGDTLGGYQIVVEAPAAPSEGEENPNTGAESVIGVVAAMAVVSVAAAAAVSLKK